MTVVPRPGGWPRGAGRRAGGRARACQALLARLVLSAGGFKLAVSWEVMAEQMVVPLSELFARFVAACEVLGALGLVLPGLTRIHRELAPIAAETTGSNPLSH